MDGVLERREGLDQARGVETPVIFLKKNTK